MECDREETFRGEIVSSGLWEPESGAIAVSLTARANEIWNPETQAWEPWAEYEMDCEGNVWVVSNKSKGNKLLDKAVENLMLSTGWDGNFQSIVEGTWKPTPISWSTQREVYKDKETFKINFINPYNRTPGGGTTKGNVDATKAKALTSQYGAQLRAMAANAKKAGPPTGKPPAPPAAKLQGVDPNQQRRANAALAVAGDANEDVPY